MKKTVIALAIALSFTAVAAQAYEYSSAVDNYTVANNRQKYCSNEGRWAALLYNHQNDVPYVSRDSMLDGVHQETLKNKTSDLDEEIDFRTIRYVYDHASDADDASQGAYAACMDLLTAGDSQVR